jgi:hypothetical protein
MCLPPVAHSFSPSLSRVGAGARREACAGSQFRPTCS